MGTPPWCSDYTREARAGRVPLRGLAAGTLPVELDQHVPLGRRIVHHAVQRPARAGEPERRGRSLRGSQRDAVTALGHRARPARGLRVAVRGRIFDRTSRLLPAPARRDITPGATTLPLDRSATRASAGPRSLARGRGAGPWALGPDRPTGRR